MQLSLTWCHGTHELCSCVCLDVLWPMPKRAEVRRRINIVLGQMLARPSVVGMRGLVSQLSLSGVFFQSPSAGSVVCLVGHYPCPPALLSDTHTTAIPIRNAIRSRVSARQVSGKVWKHCCCRCQSVQAQTQILLKQCLFDQWPHSDEHVHECDHKATTASNQGHHP